MAPAKERKYWQAIKKKRGREKIGRFEKGGLDRTEPGTFSCLQV